MAVVILPFGYPVQSGTTYNVITYQGNVVRSYVLPVDPRTNEQLFERRLLSDTSKMRTMLNDWGRAAATTVFGVKWATSIYQLLRADENSRWSEAESAWNAMTNPERAAWLAAAPYQATFNDPGKVFYVYARALVALLYDFSGLYWEGSVWAAGDSAAALAWWNRDLSGAMGIGDYQYDSPLLTRSSNWTVVTAGSDHYLKANAIGEWCEFYYCAKSWLIRPYYIGGFGNADVFHDGEFFGNFPLAAGSPLCTGFFEPKGLHLVRFVATVVNTQMWDITIAKTAF